MADAELEIVPVWRQQNDKVRQDALDLWRRCDALPSGVDPEERLNELAAGGYVDGKLAGVASAAVISMPRLGHYNFASWRTFVDPEYRLQHISQRLGLAHFGAAYLQDWAAAHPEANLAGCAMVMENLALFLRPTKGKYRTTEEERDEMPPVVTTRILKEDAPHYSLAAESPIVFAGYSPEGRAIFVRWFPDFRVKSVRADVNPLQQS